MDAVLDQPILCPILIGRDAAVDGLVRRLQQTREGAGQILLLSGEAGIGKSRLVAEAKDRAAADGFLIVQGQCFEPDQSLPYAPLRDLLRSQVAGRASGERMAEWVATSPVMARLLPELAPRMQDLAAAQTLEPEQEKRRLFHELAEFLVGLAATAPLLLIVEDLHWSDDTSLEFLHLLARQIVTYPVLLLLTYRDNEVSPALAHLLAELDRGRLATDLSLRRLSGSDIEAMVRATFALKRPVRPEFRDLLAGLTDGNPFFVEEVLKSLVTAGDIVGAEAGWTPAEIGTLRAPRSVHDAVRRRVERLSESTRNALQLAAIAGRRFDFALLQDLLHIDEVALLRRMKELIAAQLVVEETADRFAFRHALTRQAILDELMGRERKLLHWQVAAAMERVYADAADGHLGDLAYHFAAAGVWPKVVDYGRRAGEQALAMQTPRAAVEHFTRAIEASKTLGLPPASVLHRLRGQANETLGEFEAARDDFEAALAAARTTADHAAEWQALIDLGFLWSARDYARTGAYNERALTLAREIGDPMLVARSLNRVGNWQMNVGWQVEARHYHDEALATFEGMGDQRGVAETLDLLGVAAFLGGNRATARTLVTRAILVCRASNIRRLLAANLAVMAELSGSDRLSLVEVSEGADIPDPMRLAQEAVEVARDIGWSAGESYSLAILALVLATQGYFGRALPTAQHGLMIAEEIGHQQWSAKAHKTLAVVCFELYALPVAQRHLEQAIALARGVRASPMREMAASLLAAVHLLQGDLPQVEAVLSEHFREDRHPMLLNDRLARKVRAELALARGDPASALAIVDQLVKEVIGDDPTITVPSLLLTRAEALLALGQWEAAAGVLATAVRGAEARGMRPLLWRLHVLIARLHQATGRMEEAKRALAIARTIIDQITENLPDEPVAELGGHSLGANFRAMISDQIPGLLPRTPRQSAKHAYGGLTDREREIARLIANGNSNREISGALFISERTVSTHVTNILAKLEFTSRAQIASWVSETGLADPNVNVDRR